MLLALEILIYQEPPKILIQVTWLGYRKIYTSGDYQDSVVTSFFLVVICMTLLKHAQVGYQNE